ncbi:peptide deformylase [Hujiaoplasma nucleasis]|uniref:Peptide deformylase n=1 Tax=Hujiaoplasma nucleasis TaxID=2725268 RepID=A0A7L6N1I1_9MOLU|nr:peptide deformylase [Hujiaoplasma nucleasis]QLY40120.1 peptide deformylase [Hujiaoplasma nucleasis]
MLLMKDIIQDGHPTLRLRAKEVDLPLSEENLNTLREMMNYIENSQNDDLVEEYDLRPSVGLAAPQINLSLKMFCMKTLDENFETMHQYAVVNPKIVSYSEAQTYLPGGEGCLSVDEDTTGIVLRSKWIRVKAHFVDLKTGFIEFKEMKIKGYPAIVFQHEYDHLLGVMFTDKIEESKPDVNAIEFKIYEDELDEE